MTQEMTPFNSSSEVGQDEFAYRMLNNHNSGWFLDIGSGPQKDCSNTYSLEQLGWNGFCIDMRPLDYSGRKNPLILADALSIDYRKLLDECGVLGADYLSIDVDDDSYECLKLLPFDHHPFKVITIEHDFYRVGDKLRIPERVFLTSMGYCLVCSDVICPSVDSEKYFEDWWVHSDFVMPHKIRSAYSYREEPEEILRRLR